MYMDASIQICHKYAKFEGTRSALNSETSSLCFITFDYSILIESHTLADQHNNIPHFIRQSALMEA